MCLKNKFDYLDKINVQELVVYKYINESASLTDFDLDNNMDNLEEKNIYWKLVDENNKITQYLNRIKSPYDDTYFNIMIINSKPSYVKKINIFELLNTNIFEIKKNLPITIQPIQRLYI